MNGQPNTHYAVTIGDSYEMTLVASGDEEFCRTSLDAWLVKHPLSEFGQAEILLRQTAPEQVYAAAVASGLSDYEAREEAWPHDPQAMKTARVGCI